MQVNLREQQIEKAQPDKQAGPFCVRKIVTIKTDLQMASQAGKEKEGLQAEGDD